MLGSEKNRRTLRNEIPNIIVHFGENNKNKKFNNKFPDNKIETTKYNILTWFPKSLLIQFTRAVNIYFLFVTVLTFMSFSPTLPGSMVGTFSFVLLVTMIKEAIEDYARYQQDQIANNKTVHRLEEGNWVEVKCWNLRPGDIIKHQSDEEITCDILLISSSNKYGSCFIDTKNLDGENSLKEKSSIENFQNENESDIKGSVYCHGPNSNLNYWEGKIEYRGEILQANLNNLMLKGCILKNTEYVVGVIIYTGNNTKIMRNSKRYTHKISNIQRKMNKILYSLFAVNILICIIFSFLSALWYEYYGEGFGYIFPAQNQTSLENNNLLYIVVRFLIYFVVYSQMIPISLYVGLEIIKLIQSFLIKYDDEIYDNLNDKPANCRSLDLMEELGQIEIIFSDKTGTLTQNNMILKKCYVANRIFGDNQVEVQDHPFTLNGDPRIAEILSNNSPKNKEEKIFLEEFFLLLSLCHSIYLEESSKNPAYMGSSPDDIALVKGAKQIGIELKAKTRSEFTIYNHFSEKYQKFNILVEIPFDSFRKRMSVIVEDKETNQIIIFTKGADSEIIPRLANIRQEKIEDLKRVISEFSKEGLRIIVMGKKILDRTKYDKWYQTYKIASSCSGYNATIYEQIEKELDFVGFSGIEDKLQEGVSEAISTILSCNIRIWVLTGDKLDTAQEIAKLCRLINSSMDILKIETDDFQILENLINEFMLKLGVEIPKEVNKYDFNKINEAFQKRKKKDISIIVEGISLELIFEDIKLRKKFFCLGYLAKSVICCRVSPIQKSKIVGLAKNYGNWITLSIGDGANDVPMIMEAHIGVGIEGKEGTQAARSADFCIGQFRFLEKLLLIYGRCSYINISKYICYYFYKNITLVFSQIFFAYSNGFSGQIFYADYLSNCYNAFWTSWPCLITFSLEKDVELNIVKQFPILYQAGQKNLYFNLREFWMYIFTAILHGLLIYIIPVYGLKNSAGSSGLTLDHWTLSTLSFTLMIQIVSYKLLLLSEFWNIINISTLVISILFYYGSLFFFSTEYFSSLQPQLIGVIFSFFQSPKIWLLLVLAPFISLLPDISYKQLSFIGFPNPNQEITKQTKDPTFMATLIPNMKKTSYPDRKFLEKDIDIINKKLNSIDNKVEIPLRDHTGENLIINQTDQCLANTKEGYGINIVNTIKEKSKSKELNSNETNQPYAPITLADNNNSQMILIEKKKTIPENNNGIPNNIHLQEIEYLYNNGNNKEICLINGDNSKALTGIREGNNLHSSMNRQEMNQNNKSMKSKGNTKREEKNTTIKVKNADPTLSLNPDNLKSCKSDAVNVSNGNKTYKTKEIRASEKKPSNGNEKNIEVGTNQEFVNSQVIPIVNTDVNNSNAGLNSINYQKIISTINKDDVSKRNSNKSKKKVERSFVSSDEDSDFCDNVRPIKEMHVIKSENNKNQKNLRMLYDHR